MLKLAESKSDDAHLCRADQATELLTEGLKGRQHLVAWTVRPDKVLRELIQSAPAVICTDSLEHVFSYSLTQHSDRLQAFRNATVDLAIAYSCVRDFSSIHFNQCSFRKKSEIIEKISDKMKIFTTAHALKKIREHADSVILEPPSTSDTEEFLDLVDIDRTVAGETNRILLPNFFFSSEQNSKLIEPIEARGPERLLAWGPFIGLPCGSWNACLKLKFDSELTSSLLSVDIIHFGDGMQIVAKTPFAVTAPGKIDINIRFEHKEPAGFIEVRLFSNQNIRAGKIEHYGVEFTRAR